MHTILWRFREFVLMTADISRKVLPGEHFGSIFTSFFGIIVSRLLCLTAVTQANKKHVRDITVLTWMLFSYLTLALRAKGATFPQQQGKRYPSPNRFEMLQRRIQGQRAPKRPIRGRRREREDIELGSYNTKSKFVHHIPLCIKCDLSIKRDSCTVECRSEFFSATL